MAIGTQPMVKSPTERGGEGDGEREGGRLSHLFPLSESVSGDSWSGAGCRVRWGGERRGRGVLCLCTQMAITEEGVVPKINTSR